MKTHSGAARRIKPVENEIDLDTLVANARGATDFLKALAHEARLMILCLLVDGEKSVTEIEQTLGCGSRRCRSSWRACAPMTWWKRGATERASITRWRGPKCAK